MMLIMGSNLMRKKVPSYKGFPMFSPSTYLNGMNPWPFHLVFDTIWVYRQELLYRGNLA